MAFDAGNKKLRVRVGGDTSELNAALTNAQKRVKKFAADVTKVGQTLSTRLTLPLLAAGVAATKVAADFETGMNRVRAVSGATGDDFVKLRNQAKELGATTQFSATQAADAMGFLAQAGFKADQILGSMPDTLKLASAAQLDLASSADIVSNVLTGFQLPVSELSRGVDVLTKTFTSSNTDLTQLGQAMKFVGPIASGLGTSFEETTAALGLLGNAGLQAGTAGTGLRRILNTVTKEADKLGITSVDSAGKMLPLADIMEQLERQGFTTAEALEVFGDRGGPAISALLGQGSAALRELTGELQNAGGTADRVSKIQMEGLRGQLLTLKSAAEGLAISLGDAGLLKATGALVTGITGLVRRFDDMSQAGKTTTLVIAGLAAATGPLLLVLGQFLTIVPKVVAGLRAIRIAALLLAGPAGVVAGLVTLFGIGLVRALDSTTVSSDKAARAFDGMRERIKPAKEAVDALTKATNEEGLRGAIEKLGDTLSKDSKGDFQEFAIHHLPAILAQGELSDAIDKTLRKYAELQAADARTTLDTTRRRIREVNSEIRNLETSLEGGLENLTGRTSDLDEATALVTGEIGRLTKELEGLHAQQSALHDVIAAVGDANHEFESGLITAEERTRRFAEAVLGAHSALASVGEDVEEVGAVAENATTEVEELTTTLEDLDGTEVEVGISIVPKGDFDIPQLDEPAGGANVKSPINVVPEGDFLLGPAPTGARLGANVAAPVPIPEPGAVANVVERSLIPVPAAFANVAEGIAVGLTPLVNVADRIGVAFQTVVPAGGAAAGANIIPARPRANVAAPIAIPVPDVSTRIGGLTPEQIAFNNRMGGIAVRGRREDGHQLGEADRINVAKRLQEELEARQKVIDSLTTVSATDGPLGAFGKTLLSTAVEKIPVFGAALQGFAQAGPLGALSAVFGQLLGMMEPFNDLIGVVTESLGGIAQVLGKVLAPVFKLIGSVVAAVANVFIDIANLFGAGIKRIGEEEDPEESEARTPQGGAFGISTPEARRPQIALSVGRSNAAPAVGTQLINVADLFGAHVESFGEAVDRLLVGSDRFARNNGGL